MCQVIVAIAVKILDDDRPSNTIPAFNSQAAESFITNISIVVPLSPFSDLSTWLQNLQPQPTYEFDDEPIITKEVIQVIKNNRSSSSPSPIDQVPYRVL